MALKSSSTFLLASLFPFIAWAAESYLWEGSWGQRAESGVSLSPQGTYCLLRKNKLKSDINF